MTSSAVLDFQQEVDWAKLEDFSIYLKLGKRPTFWIMIFNNCLPQQGKSGVLKKRLFFLLHFCLSDFKKVGTVFIKIDAAQ